jgi:hypothetical protein
MALTANKSRDRIARSCDMQMTCTSRNTTIYTGAILVQSGTSATEVASSAIELTGDKHVRGVALETAASGSSLTVATSGIFKFSNSTVGTVSGSFASKAVYAEDDDTVTVLTGSSGTVKYPKLGRVVELVSDGVFVGVGPEFAF